MDENNRTLNNDVEEAPEEEKSGITFGMIWRMIIKHWVAWVIFMFVGLAGGVVYAQALRKPSYSATATMMVVTNSNDSSTPITDDNLNTTDLSIAYQRANIAVTMMNTSIVSHPATETLATTYTSLKDSSGNYDYASVSKAYSASLLTTGMTTTSGSSVVINVTATSDDAKFAVDLANTVCTTVIDLGNKDSRFSYIKNCLIVASSATEGKDTATSKAVIVLIGLLIGCVIGMLYGIIFETANNKVTSKAELDELTHVKVIGMIPNYTEDEAPKPLDKEEDAEKSTGSAPSDKASK